MLAHICSKNMGCMKARRSVIPHNLLISGVTENIGYADCFAIKLSSSTHFAIEECTRLFFKKWPAWINALFKLRNILVRPFGLYTGGEEHETSTQQDIEFRKNGKIAFFSVLDINEHDILMVGSDKHLDAWFSLSIVEQDTGRELYASTLVKFNNRFGRVYFFFIKPFHKVVIKAQLNRMFVG
jgi:hypothetical protein